MTFTMNNAVKQLESKYGTNTVKNGSDLATRTANSQATQSRMGLGDTSSTPSNSSVSNAQQTGFSNTNDAMANNPVFQAGQRVLDRNFTEDSRRFNVSTSAKSVALADEQFTNRYRSDNDLTGVKYGADAQVKATGLQADASRYGADKNLQGNMYSADRNVDAARIGADANRFNALLGAGTNFFNSSQYKPTFNR